ncbi:hypothetical protein DPMN_153694 [Dreissena polymorpha]|uniref:Uncharacterized protein n=1 Tax=Dreissena polymorpha TaxID=45954 RepID=A0A9D4FM11_DREPO|nr:hypothetical protein DPMN_153694 [Dreissena polymorpha]
MSYHNYVGQASSEHGLAYLKEHDVIARLETMLRSAQDDPLAGFLIPGKVSVAKIKCLTSNVLLEFTLKIYQNSDKAS